MEQEELFKALDEAGGEGGYVDVDNPSSVCLDGWFNLAELELIVGYMKAKRDA